MAESKKFYALALDEDQCRAVMASCAMASLQIAQAPEKYDNLLKGINKTSLELEMLYTGVVIYVGDKLGEG